MKDFLLKKRLLLVLLFKAVLIWLAFFSAFLVRFDFTIPDSYRPVVLWLFPAVLVIKLVVFWGTGLFRGWWRYVSMADLITIAKGNALASLGVIAYAAFSYRLEQVPRSVLILDGLFCFLLTGGVRFATRALRENYLPTLRHRSRHKGLTRTLVVGAGSAGQMIVREVRQNPGLKKSAVGFIDDDPEKAQKVFQGVRVLGAREDIARVCHIEKIEEIIIAIPSASGRELRPIIEFCEKAAVPFKTLPGVGDLIGGNVSVQQAREVDVQDLLGREAVRLEVDRIRGYLQGKKILVTGAAGSIGSEICRQVACFDPAEIILLDHAESPLFMIERELAGMVPGLSLVPLVGNVRDRKRVCEIFDQFMPEIVFHAAAYKHVPLMEKNPFEAVLNNVRGTKIVADAALSRHARKFVLISTDKAVNPSSVMGATKRAAEIYVQSLARHSNTQFVTVRFGNVLGSAGSVVPIFKEEIQKGGPVRVTHRDVTRYFMTIPEATQLVLQAGSMGRGGEIFILDMGEPVRITHLAEELIRLSGLRPYEDIDIVFTGLRPGEKLTEELSYADEDAFPTSHAKIRVVNSSYTTWENAREQEEALFGAAKALDERRLFSTLNNMVHGYKQKNECGVVIMMDKRRNEPSS